MWGAALVALLLPITACGRVGAPKPSPGMFFVEKGPYQAYYGDDGRILRLLHDGNGDGKADIQVLYGLDGKPLSAEIDTDRDGIVDRWEYFDPDGRIEKVALSRLTPGRPDLWIRPGAPGTPRPGDSGGSVSPAREARDTDGDGRPDQWLVFRDGRLVVEELDTDGDGKPDRRLLRGPDGQVVAIEADPGEDGIWKKRSAVRR